MKVRFPSVLAAIEVKDGNSVTGFVLPGWSAEASVTEFKQARVAGYELTLDGDTEPLLLITNGAKAPPDFDRVLRQRQLIVDGSAKELDLSQLQWEKHPGSVTFPSKLPHYEKLVSAVLDSWADSFSYVREDSATKTDGLRPPQLGADLRHQEQIAYDYFGAQNDPNLVRVVQYTSLFQIFRAFDIKLGGGRLIARNEVAERTAGIKETAALLQLCNNAKEEDIAKAAHRMMQDAESLMLPGHRWVNWLIGGRSEILRSASSAVRESRDAVKAKIGDVGIARLAELLGEIDGASLRNATVKERAAIAEIAKHQRTIQYFGDRESVLASYSNGSLTNRQSGWIRTPSVVVSWNMGEIRNSVGGHNLDAYTSRFSTNKDVPRHKAVVKIREGNLVIEVNPLDSDRVPQLLEDLRTIRIGETIAGRRAFLPGEKARVEKLLSDRLDGSAMRRSSRSVALKIEPPAKRTLPPNAREISSAEKQRLKSFDGIEKHVFVVERRGRDYAIYFTGSQQTTFVASISSAVRFLSGKSAKLRGDTELTTPVNKSGTYEVSAA